MNSLSLFCPKNSVRGRMLLRNEKKKRWQTDLVPCQCAKDLCFLQMKLFMGHRPKYLNKDIVLYYIVFHFNVQVRDGEQKVVFQELISS